MKLLRKIIISEGYILGLVVLCHFDCPKKQGDFKTLHVFTVA